MAVRTMSDPCDPQAVFNEVVGPQVLHDSTEDDAAVRLHALSQDRFPNWCSGPCGCLGRNPVRGICSVFWVLSTHIRPCPTAKPQLHHDPTAPSLEQRLLCLGSRCSPS